MGYSMQIRKVTSLPGTYEASTMYLVQSATAGLMDIYVSSSDGLTARHVITKAEIDNMIVQALGGMSAVEVVADIAARNALAPTVVTEALVLDATADPTVTSGAATYVYNPATTTWTKISEAESMDVVLQWANITGKPTSSVVDIDDAVTKRHTHANKVILDKLSENISGAPLYDGQPYRAYMDQEDW